MNPTAPAVPFSLADHQTRFRALISDLDGTLIDSEPLHMAAWNAICEKYHLPPFDYEYILSIGGMNTAEISRRRCEGRSDLDYEAVAREKIELYRSSYMQRVPLFPAIAALIREARTLGMKTAVATGSHLPETRFLLEKHGLVAEIDTIVSSDQISHSKPHPEIYLTAATRLNVEPSACLVLEDTQLGLKGAKAAGMCALQVLGGRIISDLLFP